MKDLKLVFIKWVDASWEPGPICEDEMLPYIVLQSCGFLISEDENYVNIGGDYCEMEDTWRHVFHVPKVNLLEFKTISMEKMKNEATKRKTTKIR